MERSEARHGRPLDWQPPMLRGLLEILHDLLGENTGKWVGYDDVSVRRTGFDG